MTRPVPDKPQAVPVKKGPNCWDCRFMAITWDVRMPYGCKLMGFRAKVLPSLEVLRTDGRHCSGFSAKPTPVHAQVNASAKVKAQANGPTAPTQAVGKASQRQDSDRRGPFTPINVIT